MTESFDSPNPRFQVRKLLSSDEDPFIENCQFDRCDLRFSYCDPVQFRCDSCENRCGPAALVRDPAGTQICQKICSVYYEHTTTTPRPTPVPQNNIQWQEQVNQFGDQIGELSNSLNQHGDQIDDLSKSMSEHGNQIQNLSTAVYAVGGVAVIALLIIVILVVLVYKLMKHKKATPSHPEADEPLGHNNTGHNSNHSSTDSVAGATGMDSEQSRLLSEEVRASTSGVRPNDESDTSVKQPHSAMGTLQLDVETQPKEAALAQTAVPIDETPFGQTVGHCSSIGVAQPTHHDES